MKLVVKGVGVIVTPSLRRYIGEKIVQPVAKLLQRDPAYDTTVLELELIRDTRHHRKGVVWSAAANCKLPHKQFWQRADAEDIHAAIDELADTLKRDITKVKERSRSRLLRGARRAKKDLHLSRAARLFREGRLRDESM